MKTEQFYIHCRMCPQCPPVQFEFPCSQRKTDSYRECQLQKQTTCKNEIWKLPEWKPMETRSRSWPRKRWKACGKYWEWQSGRELPTMGRRGKGQNPQQVVTPEEEEEK